MNVRPRFQILLLSVCLPYIGVFNGKDILLVPKHGHKNKNPSRNFQEGSCAPDGNRTRTAISGHGIFLLLLLLRKPASSEMFSRCSLDYFLTMRWMCCCTVRSAFRSSLYSLYAIYQHVLNLVSRRQSLHFCGRGFRLLGEFYSQSFL